ncbi:MAG TPA: hypothetical protein VLA04_02815 [Verrucomicrobiae bacterium]|nr:hypothetical protein [Verrucomicrobiae bacterium]
MKHLCLPLAVLLGFGSLSAQVGELLPPEKLNEKRTTVVIWNQHHSGFNNRGSTLLNVVLITKGKEIFRKNNVAIPWEPGKDCFLALIVPTAATDTVRVEIVESVQKGAGLAEIEFLRNEKNLAKGKVARANGVLRGDKRDAEDRLTDGITTSHKLHEGYWLSPDKEQAWAEVDVKTRD